MVEKTYHVRVSSAHMPNGVKAPYQNVAVLRHRAGPTTDTPHAIRETTKWAVVWSRHSLHLGWKPRGNTAAELAVRYATALAEELENN